MKNNENKIIVGDTIVAIINFYNMDLVPISLIRDLEEISGVEIQSGARITIGEQFEVEDKISVGGDPNSDVHYLLKSLNDGIYFLTRDINNFITIDKVKEYLDEELEESTVKEKEETQKVKTAKCLVYGNVKVCEGDIISIKADGQFISGKLDEIYDDTIMMDISERYNSRITTVSIDSIEYISLVIN